MSEYGDRTMNDCDIVLEDFTIEESNETNEEEDSKDE